MSEKLTVVLSNAFRPLNVSRLAHHYAACPLVARVLIADVGGTLPTDLPDMVTIVTAKPDPGLYFRFAVAALSTTYPVLIADDDILPAYDTVSTLFQNWRRAACSGHGLHGRNPTDTYTIAKAYGPVQVLLTRCCMVSVDAVLLALSHGRTLIEEHPGEPAGNGEDIVLSHACMKGSGVLNRAYKLPYEDLDAKSADSISVRFAKHEEHRTNVLKWCRKNIIDGRHLAG